MTGSQWLGLAIVLTLFLASMRLCSDSWKKWARNLLITLVVLSLWAALTLGIGLLVGAVSL